MKTKQNIGNLLTSEVKNCFVEISEEVDLGCFLENLKNLNDEVA